MSVVPEYKWGAWPPHLLTKKQMDEAGFQTGAQLPPPAGMVKRAKSPDGFMYLYDSNHGVPKRQMTEDQRKTLKAAADKSREGWYCTRCGQPHMRQGKRGIYAVRMSPPSICFICEARQESINWALDLVETGDFVILDTETTGLEPGDSEIVQIAVIDSTGATLLDTYVKPQKIERLTEKTNGRSASDINGITPEMLENAPIWPEVAAQLYPLVSGKTVVIYNAEYDTAMISEDCHRYRIAFPDFTLVECAMLSYAEFYGDYSTYWGSFKWQPLGGGHTALSDCLATLKLIHEMADSK
jgi:DNA polymerase-3 subunit epsilon